VWILFWVSTSEDPASALAASQSERELGERWVFTGEGLLLTTIPKKEDDGTDQDETVTSDVCSPLNRYAEALAL
jgi:hypothetical protein